MLTLAFVLGLLASAGNNIGKVLQKKGTGELPEFSFRWEVLKLYLRNKFWMFGFSIDLAGGILTVVALGMAPVSVIQPVLSAGMLFLVLFAHFYLKEALSTREWLGVSLAIAGLIGTGITLVPGEGEFAPAAALSYLLGVGALIFSCEVMFRLKKWMELASGIAAGACFGLSAAVMRTGLFFLQREGSVLSAAVGLAGSIFLTSLGFFFQTRGFKYGRAIPIGIYAGVFALLTAVFAGFFALGEPLPKEEWARIVRFASLAVIGLGSALMARISSEN